MYIKIIMTGGLIDIVTYGAQDLYLTGTPQITFFKVVYRRNTNFAIESIEVAFDDVVNFGLISHVVVPMSGDLLYTSYLKIDLPEISIPNPEKVNLFNDYGKKTIPDTPILNLITVGEFVALNTQAYRNAYTAFLAQNDTTILGMQDAIIKVFNNANFFDLVNGVRINKQNKAIYDSFSAKIDQRNPNNNTYLKNISDTIVNEFKKLISEVKDANGNLLFNIETIDLELIALAANPKTSKDNFLKKINNAMYNTNQVLDYFEKILIAVKKKIDEENNLNFKFAWVKRLGTSMIDYIDVHIGGEHIDRHYGDWLNIWYELAGKKEQTIIYKKMTGDIPELTELNNKVKPLYTLFVPLQFWFNRYNGLALPLVAIQYSDVIISVKLKPLESCCYMEKTTTTNLKDAVTSFFTQNNVNVNMSLLIDYVFLDKEERRKFAQVAHEYLIDQVETYFINENTNTTIDIKLDLNYPVKEIIWVIQKNSFITNSDGSTETMWWNYSVNSSGAGNPVVTAQLALNGLVLFPAYVGNFFNYLIPWWYHSNCPIDGINSYSFAIVPEAAQPSGTCNFTRISDARLTLKIDPTVYKLPNGTFDDTIAIRIYSRRVNILRIMGGYAALAFD